jgi:hypothetical protein
MVVDIDSFDYEIVKAIFTSNIKPRVMVVEYNPSLPHDKAYYWPVEFVPNSGLNPRLYGASFKAWKLLMKRYGYSLVHISGFCNLLYIRDDIEHPFLAPSIEKEITDTPEKVVAFCQNNCLPGFIPSWHSSPKLALNDLHYLKRI